MEREYAMHLAKELLEDHDVMGYPWQQTDREQLAVMLEAFAKYAERNAKYKDLWAQAGANDSLGHIKHKALRLTFMLGWIVDNMRDGEDDAIDLINYAAFFIRNVRAGRG